MTEERKGPGGTPKKKTVAIWIWAQHEWKEDLKAMAVDFATHDIALEFIINGDSDDPAKAVGALYAADPVDLVVIVHPAHRIAKRFGRYSRLDELPLPPLATARALAEQDLEGWKESSERLDHVDDLGAILDAVGTGAIAGPGKVVLLIFDGAPPKPGSNLRGRGSIDGAAARDGVEVVYKSLNAYLHQRWVDTPRVLRTQLQKIMGAQSSAFGSDKKGGIAELIEGYAVSGRSKRCLICEAEAGGRGDFCSALCERTHVLRQ